MKIEFTSFMGEVPHIAPHLLPEGMATLARNTRLERGDLAPIRSSPIVHSFDDPMVSFVYFAGDWVGWTVEVNAVPGPVATDRLYITGDGVPKMRLASGDTYALALPAPVTAPTTSIPSGDVDPEYQETVLYAYTWVTSLGEESAPSPLSEGLTWSPGLAVRLEDFATTPPDRLITSRRIYRSQTGVDGVTELFYVSEIALAVLTYDHDLALEPFVELIRTQDHDTPPDTMQGLIAMPNGVMAAFDGREVLFSSPFEPHAWPEKYRLKVDYDIVGLAAFSTSLAILTAGQPYVAQGSNPETMIMEKVEQPYPCMSRAGIVDLGYAAAYPSTDGLVVIQQGQGARLATSNLFTREQWYNLDPSSFRGALHNGRYLFSYDPVGAGGREMGAIDISGENPFFIRFNGSPSVIRYDAASGNAMALAANGEDIQIFDDLVSDFLEYTWTSKIYLLPFRAGFGCVLVDGEDSGAVTPAFSLEVILDGAVIHTLTSYGSVARLPPVEGKRWQLRVSGNTTIQRIILAGSPDEIAGG